MPLTSLRICINFTSSYLRSNDGAQVSLRSQTSFRSSAHALKWRSSSVWESKKNPFLTLKRRPNLTWRRKSARSLRDLSLLLTRQVWLGEPSHLTYEFSEKEPNPFSLNVCKFLTNYICSKYSPTWDLVTLMIWYKLDLGIISRHTPRYDCNIEFRFCSVKRDTCGVLGEVREGTFNFTFFLSSALFLILSSSLLFFLWISVSLV